MKGLNKMLCKRMHAEVTLSSYAPG